MFSLLPVATILLTRRIPVDLGTKFYGFQGPNLALDK